METADLKRPTICSESVGTGLQQVFDVARDPDKKWALVTASRPGTSTAEQQLDNAILRQELRAKGLPYWLLFGEWRQRHDLPTGEWRRFAFFVEAEHHGFQDFVSGILKRYRQSAGLIGVDARASIIRSTGEATELRQLDLASSVAAYGRALGGAGTLTLVRAFVPVGVFGATVKHAAENRTFSAAAR